MRFFDTVDIVVIAGDGGDGYISCKKNKNGFFVSGKSNGSNGGDGGNVWLLVDDNINTLNYFHNCSVFRAGHGQKGRVKGCTGKQGKDLYIKVPVGTKVIDKTTNKLLGSMDKHNNVLMVAKGGDHGIGNGFFKLRSNKKDNKNMCGKRGEYYELFLELSLIADVGMFGLPNSGKSSFMRSVSAAKPKVDSYPFTTLIPYLGVVYVTGYDTFVIADVPGIIKGAANGLGLGLRFLKHLERCKMLLHFVDIDPVDKSNPVENIITITRELYNYSGALYNKPCWLIFNKIDLIKEYELNSRIKYILNQLQWMGEYHAISSMYNVNVQSLCGKIIQFIKC